MNAERWKQIEEIYHAALERPPSDRSAFLKKTCDGDHELQQEVESLLANEANTHFVRLAVDAAAVKFAKDSGASLAGVEVGSYQVLSLIGKGGMGEVYAARDIRLDRKVAIKKLPKAFVSDPERTGRLEREAKLLASLNHPNVAAIYELDNHDGVSYLVMEFVPGETLAEVLKAGLLGWRQALQIAIQVTEALEAAHEKGIIHRDLKPANIKITPEKKVKVLDFGLAKALSGDTGGPDLSQLPTMRNDATKDGMILGTPAYMSPEQVRGKPLDKKTDIWSFGCVLYEMLTGATPFGGETIPDSLAKVLESEPDWELLPAEVPVAIRKLLKRCLHKEKRQRLQDAIDARLEIEDALAAPQDATSTKVPRHVPLWSIAALIAVTVITGIAAWNLKQETAPEPHPVAQLAIPLPPGEGQVGTESHSPLALSPDSTRLVYVVRRAGSSQLYLRRMDRNEFTPMPGTEGASGPFFSHDGQWVGFSSGSDGKLKKVSVNGGAPQIVCDTSTANQASWGTNETIVFATNSRVGGIYQVPASGGKATILIAPDPDKGETGYNWPYFLPGAKAILFTVHASKSADDAIVAYSLETGERRVLIEGGTRPHYVESGHIVYLRSGTLMAVPFDIASLKTTGPAIPIVADVKSNVGAPFSSSNLGWLAYVPAREPPRLVWVDRHGTAEPVPAPLRRYQFPRLSPVSAQKIAVSIFADQNESDIWVYDLARSTLSRLTTDGSSDWPLWSPDEKQVTFSSDKGGSLNIYWKPADSSGPEEQLTLNELKNSEIGTPRSWTPDGESLIFDGNALSAVKGFNTSGSWIWLLSLHGDRTPRPMFQTPFSVGWSRLSPDGHWLAYVSKEFPRSEVYLRPFPGPGGVLPVSTDGGTEPVWNPNGRELFYRNADKMMVVEITTQPRPSLSKPRMLFESSQYARVSTTPNYDVSPDGQRFLMIQDSELQSASQLNVIVNWFEELKKKTPAK